MNGDDFINKLLLEFGGIRQHELALLLGKKNSQLSGIRKQKNVSAITVARMMAHLHKQIVRGDSLLPLIQRKLHLDKNKDLAEALGMSGVGLRNWKIQKKGITPAQIVNAIAASKKSSKKETHKALIRPIVEFFPLEAVISSGGTYFELFATKADASHQQKELRDILEKAKGIYIFYDSQGKAVYAGKAQKRPLWSELKSVFNRSRKTQAVYRVRHPQRNQNFVPAYKKQRQPRKTQVILNDIAVYISIYEVDTPMISSLEALLVRGFANDLLNVRMEKFSSSKSRKKVPKTVAKKNPKLASTTKTVIALKSEPRK